MLGGVVAGAATVGVGGTATAAASTPTETSGGDTTLTLQCNALRLSTAGKAEPAVGESALISGDLTDQAGGEGALHGEYRSIAASSMVGTGAPTSMETHHFVLANGTITGSGVASLDDTPDSFTIIGGTGAFHNATGSYTAIQQHLGLGGNGQGTYSFTLTNNTTHTNTTTTGA